MKVNLQIIYGWKQSVREYQLWNIGWYTYSSEHAFECHNSYSKIIHWYSVILSAHDLRSHITWCTTRVLCIVRSPHSCNAEISNSHVPICINDQIFRLYVSMNNILVVNVFESLHQTCNEKAYNQTNDVGCKVSHVRQ